MFSMVLIFTATFIFRAGKKICFEKHHENTLYKFKSFEEISTMGKTDLLKTTPNVKCMVT